MDMRFCGAAFAIALSFAFMPPLTLAQDAPLAEAPDTSDSDPLALSRQLMKLAIELHKQPEAYEKRLNELLPQDTPGRLVKKALADHYMNQRRYREAADAYGEVLDATGDRQPAVRQIQALTGGRFFEEAKERLVAARKRFGNSTPLTIIEAENLAAAGDTDAALETIDASLAKEPENFGLKETRAELLYATGRRDEAIAALEALGFESLTHKNQARLFDEYRRTGNHERVVEVGPKVALHPMYAKAVPGLVANSLIALGRNREAEEALLAQIEVAPDEPFWHRQLAALYVERLGQPERALPIADEIARRWPQSSEAGVIRSAAFKQMGRLDEAVAALTQAAAIKPAPKYEQERARLLLRLGRIDEARAAYDAAIRLAMEENQAKQVQALKVEASGLDVPEATGPDTKVETRLLEIAEAMEQARNPHEAVAIGRLALQFEDPGSRVASRALADRLFKLGQYGEAVTLYESLAAPGGDHVVQLRLIETYGRMERYDEALRLLDAVVAERGQTAVTAMLRVVLVNGRDGPAAAIDAATAGLAEFPSHASLHRERGKARLATKDPAQHAPALEDFEAALRLEDDVEAARFGVAAAASLERWNDVHRLGQPLVDRGLATSRVVATMAVASWKQGQTQRSAELYALAAKLAPEDVTILNNLAYLLVDELDQPDAALPYARRAASLAPEDPNVLDTLGVIYFKQSNLFAAITWLERSLAKKELPSTLLHYAQVLDALDRYDEAEAALERATRAAQEQQDTDTLERAARFREARSRS